MIHFPPYRYGNPAAMGGGAFDPLSLSPALWLKADAGVVSGGARQFTAANSEYLSIADNASLSAGDIDFWIAAWVYADSLPGGGGYPGIVTKYSLASGQNNYFLIYQGDDGLFQFGVSNDGSAATVVNASTFGSPTTGTWYFVFAYHDATANVIRISVNGGAFNSSNHSTGAFDGNLAFEIGRTNGLNYWNGRIDAACFGKSPPGGFATTTAASIAASLYNSNNGVTYADLSAAQKTAWGLVSFWDLNELSGAGIDRHGSNTLLDNNTVTAAQGKMEGAALSDGDPVTTWQDQSGNARHAVQAIASKRPTLKLAIQNGLPVVRSDGSDDFLLTSSFTHFPSKRGTVFVVYKNLGTGNRVVGTYVSAVPWLAYTTLSGAAYKWHDAVSDLTADANDANAFLLQSFRRTADTTLEFYNAGALAKTFTIANNQPGSSTMALSANVDGSSPASMDICEVLIFDTDLSAGNMTSVTNYLNTRWGVY